MQYFHTKTKQNYRGKINRTVNLENAKLNEVNYLHCDELYKQSNYKLPQQKYCILFMDLIRTSE